MRYVWLTIHEIWHAVLGEELVQYGAAMLATTVAPVVSMLKSSPPLYLTTCAMLEATSFGSLPRVDSTVCVAPSDLATSNLAEKQAYQ